MTDLDNASTELIEKAKELTKKSYAPYSKFRVGCVIIDDKGRAFTGCNVENASFGATLCAERVAVGKMISEGSFSWKKIVIVADSAKYAFPCGICLQVLSEFGNGEVLLANKDASHVQQFSFSELLPKAFEFKGENP